jgi:enoyl-CoA hydratase
VETSPIVRLEINGPVAEIVLNRPDQRNAVSSELLGELLVALKSTAADDAVRVVLVRGAGPAFCAGNDLKERARMSVDEVIARRR